MGRSRNAENALMQIRSNDENRQNRLRSGNVRSDWIETESGCPHSSSLSSIRWNKFQNDNQIKKE